MNITGAPTGEDDGTRGRATKASRVYAALREEILSGRLGAGAVLDEADLAGSFEVSRTPVREALRSLQQDGLLLDGPRRQLFVIDVSEHRREVVLLREALEGAATVEACRRLEPADLDGLRLTVIRQRRAARSQDTDEFFRLDEEFHRALAGVARMPLLSMLLGQLGAFVHLARAGQATDTDHMLGVAEEHERLVDLLEARDALTLRAALTTHIHDLAPRHTAGAPGAGAAPGGPA
ncbi:GntR family transcriptional regulator [Streptomyces sp. DK15]|uniref:GntR family transcriptional regulator n=1 Tax=Streptomyces sp. DK15 TaxID=2957499 RepID=UPI0029BE7BCE|nr:GntR family transcriptional regulator [Streptomyces sp. DK15]MDX2394083.1 GntR family transcriptional regulator [Streptomyces sp. DK15]